MAQERIYIGGLNPPRLSGQDILRRLKSLETVEITSSSVSADDASENDYFQSGGKPYLHITAKSRDESVSALSIIHKHYHNVKWKGCKLVVELAKPHFLERLQQERLDREKQKAEQVTELDSKEPEVNDIEEYSRIPRRLRVRKKHGDTAVHIDTKPWTVETWSRFHKARTKLKQREEKHNANIVANKSSRDEHFFPSGPLMHRAVHIRFATDNTNTSGKSDLYPSEKHDDVGGLVSSDDSSTSSSSSSESDSDSESSRTSSTEKNAQSSTKKTPDTYEWSDDGSDSDDSETPNDSLARKTVNFDSKTPAEDEEAKHETYHWSTDDDSSEEDDDKEYTKSSFPSRDKQELKQVSATQEFAAGFDDAPFNEDEDKDFGEDEDPYDFNHGTKENFESDLVGDVSSNLNILSCIFPDMANTKPMNPESEDKSMADGDSMSATPGTKKHNSNLGIMPRFDPSAKSSEKYIVEDEQQEEEETNLSSEEKPDEDEVEDDESNSDDEKEKENDTKEKLPNVSTVYEQDKLENVFRSARDAWTEDQNSVPVSGNSANDSNPSEKSSSFSFGFHVDDNKSNDVQNQTNESSSTNNAFSFGFNVPEQDTKDEPTVPGNDGSTTDQKDITDVQAGALASSANDSDDESSTDDYIPRHRGLTLPEEDLRKYVDNFFACNDGARILENPQEFMNDEKDRAEWNSERQTLTLDWKRKRKYAVTRIQKRMKVRRR